MQRQRDLTKLAPLIAEAASVAGDADLERMLRTLVKEAQLSTGAQYAALGVVGDHAVLTDFIYEGIDPEQAEVIGPPPTGHGVLGTVIRLDQTIVLDSISAHPDSVGFPDHHPPMENFLGVPVSLTNEQFGNLYLTNKAGGFTQDDIDHVEALSRIAGAAIQTARLQSRLRAVALVEDRQRIARDLHDSVIQDLFAVGLGLQAVGVLTSDERVAEAIYSAVDSLDSSVNALRKYIFELKDTSQPPVNLDERMQSLVARMATVYPSRVTLSIDPELSGPWDEHVVSLTTEALSNALRHSKAEHVYVEVSEADSDVVLTVKDDGIGFSPEEPGRGMGLSNMRSRARSLGATFDLTSSEGAGTTVRVVIPSATQR